MCGLGDGFTSLVFRHSLLVVSARSKSGCDEDGGRSQSPSVKGLLAM